MNPVRPEGESDVHTIVQEEERPGGARELKDVPAGREQLTGGVPLGSELDGRGARLERRRYDLDDGPWVGQGPIGDDD